MEALAKISPSSIETPASSWTRERIDLIKRTVCPKGITDDEFSLFIEQCKRSGLDPLLKEAFCVPRRMNIGSKDHPNWITKHEFQPSEAGMLSRAERFGDCRGVSAAAVHEGDACEVDAGAGTVAHKFNPAKKRGALLGAWGRIQRDGKADTVVWLDLPGYIQNTPLWSKIPGTMIEKCARAAVLRKAYPSAFGGLYIREEMPAEEYPDADRPALTAGPAKQSKTESVKAAIKSKITVVDVAPGQTEADAVAATEEAPAPSEPTPYEKVAVYAREVEYPGDGKALSKLIKDVTGHGWKEVVASEVPALKMAIDNAVKAEPKESAS